ncbi:MAG: GNAT family N-acetyltransferase [Polaribacter sp.]|uniref:GNAT family N-acetyltransferase n=1 Tax=Polaribacter sp. TaxID=1920175 RepID=UPI0032676A20
MIKYIKRKDLNTIKYDACIEQSIQSRIYAFSWYLDIVAENWDVLVLGDYDAVMPIPLRKKYGIKYIYTPFWLIQLGIFTREDENENEFLIKLFETFRFVETRTNTRNSFSMFHLYQKKRHLQFLDLKEPYEILLSKFRRDRKKDLLKAKKNKLFVKIEYSPKNLIDLHSSNVGKRVKEFKEKDYATLTSLMKTCIKRKKGEILSVYNEEGMLVASGFFLMDKKRIVKLVSSTDFNNRKNGANTFLIERAICRYYKGYEFFDFGGSSIESIKKFNLSFGSSIENYIELKYNNLPKLLKFFKK